MAGRERMLDRARVRAGQHLVRTGQEIHVARLNAGLTLLDVGRAIGRSHTEVSRIERGVAPHVPLETLVLAAAAVGLDLPLRTYPAGEPIRDQAQLGLLGKLRAALGPGLTWRTEVPIDVRGDLRAWDAAIGGRGWTVPVDAETRLYVQALTRRLALKRRGSESDVVLLLVSDTRHNRTTLRVARAELAADFPLAGASILSELAASRRPAASGIVLL